MNPLDLGGEAFLHLYVGLFAAVVLAGMAIPRLTRSAGRWQAVTEPAALAVLAGGPTRLAEAVVARLLAAKALLIDGKRFVAGPAAAAAAIADRRVLSLSQPMSWTAIAAALHPEASAIERRLAAAGLMLDADEVAAARWRQTLPYLLLLGFGALKLAVGLSRGRPVGLLVALLALTAILALIRWATIDRRTAAGLAALTEARQRAERLRLASTTAEIEPAVALFGTAVLLGSGWAAFHKLRSASDGGGDSSSDSGGGCGGGGCGGCS